MTAGQSRERQPAQIRALVLDHGHRCLLIRRRGRACWEIPSAEVAWPDRPLVALQEFMQQRLGLGLPSPSGSCVPPDGSGPRDFVFLLNGRSAGSEFGLRPDTDLIAEWTLVPLARAAAVLNDAGAAATFWRIYSATMLGGYQPPSTDLDVFCFGDSPVMAARLAHLVIKGHKRVSTGFIAAMEQAGETIPRPGLISVVTDYFGYPLCIIETVEVRRVPFGEVAGDVAMGEGEGDLTYADWRDGHLGFISREAQARGLAFDDSSLVYNEIFRVMTVLGQAGEPTPT